MQNLIPGFPDVRLSPWTTYLAPSRRNEEVANGYAGSGFTVLADTNQSVLGLYQATMGTTIVIDGSGLVRMNEDYKDGARLRALLTGLP
jgi:hypothetical protein